MGVSVISWVALIAITEQKIKGRGHSSQIGSIINAAENIKYYLLYFLGYTHNSLSTLVFKLLRRVLLTPSIWLLERGLAIVFKTYLNRLYFANCFEIPAREGFLNILDFFSSVKNICKEFNGFP